MLPRGSNAGKVKRALLAPETPKTWYTKLDGGEDLTTPALEIDPGALLFSKNYEAGVQGGYTKVGLFERFDGRAKPSEATYHLLGFDQGVTAFVEGDTVTGATSGATGEVMDIQKLTFDNGKKRFLVGNTITGGTSSETAEITWVHLASGSWRGGDAAGYLYLKSPSGAFVDNEELTSSDGRADADGTQSGITLETGTWVGGDAAGTLHLCKVSGTFIDNENLQVSAVTRAVSDGVALENGASTDPIDRSATLHAISNVRADIGAITGSGVIRGILGLNGVIYGLRDNVGGTAKDLWKSTSAGWVQITMPFYLDFDTGSAEFSVGDVVTGVTSGASGTVDAVMLLSGSAGGGDQTGRLYLSSLTGTFQDNETLQVLAATKALADGTQVQVVIEPGGKVESVVRTFTGSPNDKKIYGVDGVSSAFEFDGTNFYLIPAPVTADTPTHIIDHKDYLFLALGSSAIHSGLGTPRDMTAIAGAVEIATGDQIVGFSKNQGDILTMHNRTKTYLLYGNVSAEWDLRLHSADSGAIEWSVKTTSNPIYLDDMGLMSLSSTDTYGDFRENSISQKIDPIFTAKKTLVSTSMRVKTKNQYRLFFTDGTGIHARIDRKKPAYTRVGYGKTVYAALSTEDTDGSELLFFGSDDGYIYQLDVGRSADGEPAEGYIRINYWHLDSPRVIKRFLQAVLQLDSTNGANISFSSDYDYGSGEKARNPSTEFDVISGGGYWDISTWGEFVWDSQSVGEAVAHLDGSGENISLLVYSKSASELPHTLQSIIVKYTRRGPKR